MPASYCAQRPTIFIVRRQIRNGVRPMVETAVAPVSASVVERAEQPDNEAILADYLAGKRSPRTRKIYADAVR